MEEVDSILIQQLREIGCDIDEDVTTIKDFSTETVMQCTARCLTVIRGEESELVRSNMNMANKYKIATQLADQCSQLSYVGDIGYQTFLYSNESEIRRLLLFLMEKLSKDVEPAVSFDVTSETILNRLSRMPINMTWALPREEDKPNISWRAKPNVSVINSKSVLMNKLAPAKRRYYDQCARFETDLASILEWNTCQLNSELQVLQGKSKCVKVELLGNKSSSDASLDETDFVTEKSQAVKENLVTNEKRNEESLKSEKDLKEERTEHNIEQLEKELLSLQEEIERINSGTKQVAKLEKKLAFEKERLYELNAVNKSEVDLQSDINRVKSDIQQMAQQWQLISTQLTHQLKQLKLERHIKNDRNQQIHRQINELKKSINVKVKDIKSKDILLEELRLKMPEQFPPNRASYTKRILEIVNNVKKQNEETNKVLYETRTLQKEINSLSGKLSRTFTLTDEMIFREAKTNEFNRRCYKLLASMHEFCDQSLENITEIGTILREIRQFEELIENEKSRTIAYNLTRIQADLNQMKIENHHLAAKIQPKDK